MDKKRCVPLNGTVNFIRISNSGVSLINFCLYHKLSLAKLTRLLRVVSAWNIGIFRIMEKSKNAKKCLNEPYTTCLKTDTYMPWKRYFWIQWQCAIKYGCSIILEITKYHALMRIIFIELRVTIVEQITIKSIL